LIQRWSSIQSTNPSLSHHSSFLSQDVLSDSPQNIQESALYQIRVVHTHTQVAKIGCSFAHSHGCSVIECELWVVDVVASDVFCCWILFTDGISLPWPDCILGEFVHLSTFSLSASVLIPVLALIEDSCAAVDSLIFSDNFALIISAIWNHSWPLMSFWSCCHSSLVNVMACSISGKTTDSQRLSSLFRSQIFSIFLYISFQLFCIII